MFQANERLMISLGCKLKTGSYYLSLIDTKINTDHIVFYVLDTQTDQLHYVEYPITEGMKITLK